MAAIIKTQSALIGGPSGDIVLSHSAPLPPEPLKDDQVAVAIKAVSLNPVDTKMTGTYHTPGAVLGCEFAGIVTAAGSVATSDWDIHVGDRVSAAIMGMNPLQPRIGAFAQYTTAPAHVVLKVRDGWTFAQAAGLGNAWYTVPWALFHALGLPPGPKLEPLNSRMPPSSTEGPKIPMENPNGTKRTVLVSGGSSSTGTCAIQLLNLAGFDVVATCSPGNFALARSYGADEVFDYTSPTCAADIRAHTRNSLRLVLDCITTTETMRLCYAAMGRAGGRYVALEPYSEAVAATRAVVRPDWVLGPEMIGDEVGWPAPHGRKANPAAKAFCEEWNRTLQGLLDRGMIRTHPLRVRDTGLTGALEGLEEIRAKKVSGQKLVYTS
ncbi:Enoyl reductase LovC [Cytospora mali]|uniref:Enoyl reductase LovC n=1 Tax=Cytospora mali TaxID=578113 RepID=A0A194UXF6_CYTMA|nr:Enoyl reductase LovC [Valsa mali var. pyri (nom. inval.)]